MGPPKLLSHVSGWSWLMLHNFLNPLKQAAAGLSEPQAHNYQPRFTAWLHREISEPSTSSSHLRLLYTSGRVAQGKTLVGADLGLHHPGNPRDCTPSGQLQTTSEYHHPDPAQLILRWQRLVITGHSQSLQLTGLGKSLPLLCKQQSRFNYKWRVYSAHMEGAPQIPRLDDRGGCAIGY